MPNATLEGTRPQPSEPEPLAIQHPKGASGVDPGVTWESHRLAASMIRAATVVVPALFAMLATWALGSRLHRPVGWASTVWFAGLLAFGAIAYFGLEHIARRLLPLAALLQLSLVMPDHTASRYHIALLAGTTRHLKQVVADAEVGHFGDTPAQAAERVLVLVAALNRHDRLTRGHSERVRAYAEVIGQELGLGEVELSMLRWAALLHDVGKIAVPEEILNKRERLTDEEFEVIKTHPAVGAEMVEPLRCWLGEAVDAVGQHHERWDGAGYPVGLAGEEISLAGRIVAVADTFDVITSSRSYKRAMTPTAARQEIARCAGTQFDPKVTRALLTVSIGRLWVAGGALTWGTSLPVLAQVPVGGGLLPAVGNAVAGAVAAAAIVVGGAPVVAAHVASSQPVAAHAGVAADATPVAGEGNARSGETPRSGGSVGVDGSGREPAPAVPDAEPATTVPDLGIPTAADAPDPADPIPTTSAGGPTAGTPAGTEPAPPAAPRASGTPRGAAGAVTNATNGIAGAVTGASDGLAGAVTGVTNGLGGTVNRVTGGSVSGVTTGVTGTVNGVTNGVSGTVDGVTGTVAGTVNRVTGLVGGLFGHR